MRQVADCASAMAEALRRAGYGNAFGLPPAAWLCPEPVVCSDGEWRLGSRQADGTLRGVRRVEVRCCMDDPRDAEATCRGVAADLADMTGWAWMEADWGIRLVHLRVGRPFAEGRDGSGRWVWRVDADVTVVVDDG